MLVPSRLGLLSFAAAFLTVGCGDDSVAPMSDTDISDTSDVSNPDAIPDSTPSDTEDSESSDAPPEDTIDLETADTLEDSAADSDAPRPAASVREVRLLDPGSVDFDTPEPIVAVVDIADFEAQRDLASLTVSSPDITLAAPVSLATDVPCPAGMTCLWVDLAAAAAPGLTTLTFALGDTSASSPLGLRRPAAAITIDRIEPLALPDLGRMDSSMAVDLDGDGVDEVVALAYPDAPLPNGTTASGPVWSVVSAVDDAATSHPAGLRFGLTGSWPAATVEGADGPLFLLDARIVSHLPTGKQFRPTWTRLAAPAAGAAEPGFIVGVDVIDADGVSTRVLARGAPGERLIGLVEGDSGTVGVLMTRDCCAGLQRDITLEWPDSGTSASSLGLSDELEDALLESVAGVAARIERQSQPRTGGTRDLLTLTVALPAGVRVPEDQVCGDADHFRALRIPTVLQAGTLVRMPMSCVTHPRLTQRIAALSPTAVHARLTAPEHFEMSTPTGAPATVSLGGLGAVVTRPDDTMVVVYEIHQGTSLEGGASSAPQVTLFEGQATGAMGSPYGWNTVKAMHFDPRLGASVLCDQLDVRVTDDDLGSVFIRVPGPGCGSQDESVTLATRPVGIDNFVERDETFLVAGPGGVCGHYTQVVWASTSKVGCGVRTQAEVSPSAGSDLDGSLRVSDGLAHHEPPPTTAQPFDGVLSPGGGDMFGYRVTKISTSASLLVTELGGPVLMRPQVGGAASGARITAGPRQTYLTLLDAEGELVAATRIDGRDVHVEPIPDSPDPGAALVAYRPNRPTAQAPQAPELVLAEARADDTLANDETRLLVSEFARVTLPQGWDDPREVKVLSLDRTHVLLSRRYEVGDLAALSLAVLSTTPGSAAVVVDVPLPASTVTRPGDIQGTVAITSPVKDGKRPVVIVTGTGAIGGPAVAVRLDAMAFASSPSLALVEVVERAPPDGLGLVPFRTLMDGAGEVAVLLATVDARGTVKGGASLPGIMNESQWSNLALVPNRGINHWGDRDVVETSAARLSEWGAVDINGDGLTDLLVGGGDGSETPQTSWPTLLAGVGGGQLAVPEPLGASWHGAWLVPETAPAFGALLTKGGTTSRTLTLQFGGPGAALVSGGSGATGEVPFVTVQLMRRI